jgi:hypothetical protein
MTDLIKNLEVDPNKLIMNSDSTINLDYVTKNNVWSRVNEESKNMIV